MRNVPVVHMKIFVTFLTAVLAISAPVTSVRQKELTSTNAALVTKQGRERLLTKSRCGVGGYIHCTVD